MEGFSVLQNLQDRNIPANIVSQMGTFFSNMPKDDHVFTANLHISFRPLNPSNAMATFVQNPVMLVFIG